MLEGDLLHVHDVVNPAHAFPSAETFQMCLKSVTSITTKVSLFVVLSIGFAYTRPSVYIFAMLLLPEVPSHVWLHASLHVQRLLFAP